MNYEFDDVDLALIAKLREAVGYSDEGHPIRDFVDEDDLIEAARLLLKVHDAAGGDA